MDGYIKNRFKAYEEDTTKGKYLIVSINKDEDFMEYVLKAICDKEQSELLEVELERRGLGLNLRYDISLKSSLDDVLRRKISKEDFIKLIKSLISSISKINEYRITDKNFVLCSEYIYVNRENNVSLVYIPVKREVCEDVDYEFKKLLIDIIQNKVICDDGSLIGDLMFYLRRENFTIDEFSKYINSLNIVQGKKVNKRKEKKGIKIIYSIVLVQLLAIGLIIGEYFFLKNRGIISYEIFVGASLGIFIIDLILVYFIVRGKNKRDVKEVQNINKNDISKDREYLEDDRCINMNKANVVSREEEKKAECESHYKRSKGSNGGTVKLFDDKSNGTVKLGNNKVEGDAFLIRNSSRPLEKSIIDKTPFKIGRSKEIVDLFIDNPKISREHAEIIIRKNKFYIKDNGATNKTYLNRQMLNENEEVEIKSEDVITFANIDYMFKIIN